MATETYTLTFDENIKGWTSFYDFYPEAMIRVNNTFYTVKNGQLYKHHESGNYNAFYGEQFTSKVVTVLNDEPSLDKIYKTLIQEAKTAWKTTLKTNFTESHIKQSEFNQRESKFYAYMRKNESENDLHSVAQGIGVIENINGLEIEFTQVPGNVSIGDNLYQIRLEEKELIGEITDIQNTTITVDAFTNAPEFDAFCFSKKDARIEGSEMRGYYLEITLEDETTDQNELFGISSEITRSYL